MTINITNSQKIAKVDIRKIKQAASNALIKVGEQQAELSIDIVDDNRIRYLNQRYRHLDRATDVLAFSMREGQALKGAEGMLGDIVISAETARRQARRYKKTIDEEVNLYIVHGILHLAGYNDNTARARRKMERMETEILRFVG